MIDDSADLTIGTESGVTVQPPVREAEQSSARTWSDVRLPATRCSAMTFSSPAELSARWNGSGGSHQQSAASHHRPAEVGRADGEFLGRAAAGWSPIE